MIRYPVVKVDLGLKGKDEIATISLVEMTVRASSALPAAIEQKEAQYLLWKSNSTYVESLYQTEVERVKIRYVSLLKTRDVVDRLDLLRQISYHTLQSLPPILEIIPSLVQVPL